MSVKKHIPGRRKLFNREFNQEECCIAMACYLNDIPGRVVLYEPSMRMYGVVVPVDASKMKPISYCPWCQTKLPDSLEKELIATLYDEYGITFDPETFMNDFSIPAEFKTNDWWKRRNL